LRFSTVSAVILLVTESILKTLDRKTGKRKRSAGSEIG
jgi:hypothetical protein